MSMPSAHSVLEGMMRRLTWLRRTGAEPPARLKDAPISFGEIIAASTIPDFGGLPLEVWPGYRDWDVDGIDGGDRYTP